MLLARARFKAPEELPVCCDADRTAIDAEVSSSPIFVIDTSAVQDVYIKCRHCGMVRDEKVAVVAVVSGASYDAVRLDSIDIEEGGIQ